MDGDEDSENSCHKNGFNNNDHEDKCRNNNVSSKKKQPKQSQQRHRQQNLDLNDSRPDLDDTSNDALVIDTSGASVGDVEAAQDQNPKLDNAEMGGVVVPRVVAPEVKNGAESGSSSPASTSSVVGVLSAKCGGNGLVLFSPARTTTTPSSSTLSFDIKSVINGAGSPPRGVIAVSSTPATGNSSTSKSAPISTSQSAHKLATPGGTAKRKSSASEAPSTLDTSTTAKKRRKSEEDGKTKETGVKAATPVVKLEKVTPNGKTDHRGNRESDKSKKKEEKSGIKEADKNKRTVESSDGKDSSKKDATKKRSPSRLVVKKEVDNAPSANFRGEKSPSKTVVKKEPVVNGAGQRPESPLKKAKKLSAGAAASPLNGQRRASAQPQTSKCRSPGKGGGEGGGGKSRSKSASPSKDRSPPLSIVPLNRPFPNQRTIVRYFEHFQEWTIEEFEEVVKLFTKPGTYVQGGFLVFNCKVMELMVKLSTYIPFISFCC